MAKLLATVNVLLRWLEAEEAGTVKTIRCSASAQQLCSSPRLKAESVEYWRAVHTPRYGPQFPSCFDRMFGMPANSRF